VSDNFDEADHAATPLTEQEKKGLILPHIAFRRELNIAEQENIARGRDWAMRRNRDLLSEKFIKDLHRHMLGDVWRWAGKFRNSPRNIGINHWEIPMALRMLIDNAKTWIEKKSFPPDEIAVRFHHQLVQIHPFPNGNGRHARLMADLLTVKFDCAPFTWGQGSLQAPGTLRRQYVEALRSADNHDCQKLLAFARS
jgi:Fic-DOC domain mobile mystery protein B